MVLEYAFELASSSIRFGAGVTREVGMDLAEMKAQRVMVLTDANLARLPPPGPLKPLIAVPTTAGTGSETTGVAIFDYTPLHAKTGIAHRRLKPTLGILDPGNTRTMPPQVAAASGFDVLSHAIESYTALPFQRRPRPERPVLRPAYQGSNPISDVWSLEALRWVAKYFVLAVEDPDDDEARAKMQLRSEERRGGKARILGVVQAE